MRTFPILAALLAVAAEWRQMPSLPDKEGFAGSFAGVSGNVMLVAGGANFPDKRPWQGGKKVWHDTVFVLTKPSGQWKTAGRLPRPLAYGVSATHGGGVVCVGGSDAQQHYADAFRLEWKNDRLIASKLPALPTTVADACGALLGDTLIVAGGRETPDAKDVLKAVWKIDLSSAEPKWQALAPCPGGGRMLAVAAAFDGKFWLIGGVDLISKDGKNKRRYRKDAYCYHLKQGWKRIADLPSPLAAAPSPAATDATGIYLFGGDDGTQIEASPARHRGFSKKMFHYDAKADRWTQRGETPAPRVTTPCLRWGKGWIVPSGEVRPGVRSPEVWRLYMDNKE